MSRQMYDGGGSATDRHQKLPVALSPLRAHSESHRVYPTRRKRELMPAAPEIFQDLVGDFRSRRGWSNHPVRCWP
jgi:hypothetical protein